MIFNLISNTKTNPASTATPPIIRIHAQTKYIMIMYSNAYSRTSQKESCDIL